MPIRSLLVLACALPILAGALPPASAGLPQPAAAAERRFLYVAQPGIRNYVEHGGIGVIVFDIDNGHRFVRRIPTVTVPAGEPPENVKGIAASAVTGRLYVSTIKRVLAFDLATDALLWNRTYDGGCDRLALSPDGRVLYVPSLEGPHWHVLDALTGDPITRIVTGSGAHNTVFGPDGREVYLAGLKAPVLSVSDTRTHTVVRTVGPFGNVIRPFTVNSAQTLCFVNVNDLLGFEVGDLRSGRVLHRVAVTGFEKGPTKRHGCPSHGVALTPDERELWITDAANSRAHVFDATVMPPVQVASIALRDQPGWITFSIDGRFAYPSTGDIVETATRRIVTTLTDEEGRAVQGEKMLEVVFAGGRAVAAGDQFGIGRGAR
jgi:DNA-binding beta-propeller fold protein YncE